jgi:tetratricopeptide (TPR) repeat protein
LYVGLFWQRAGDKEDLENIYITEMEFYRAVNTRKSIRIYVIEANPSTVDRDLYLFLKTLKEDPLEGQCIRPCKSADDLINKLRNDLEYFEDCRSKGETPHWTSYCLLEEALKKRGLLKPRLEPYQLHVTEQINRDFLQQKIEKMQEHFNRSEFPEAADIGANLLHGFLSLRISPENKELLPLWAIFLRMWSGSCTWLGLIDGTFGSLWAAKMQKRTFQILGWWGSMYGSANLISNAYYVLARQSENKKYSSDTTPEYRDKLEAERREFLETALDYDEIYRTRVRTPEPKLYSSYIYQALGDYDRAASGFERLLSYRVDTSNAIGYLGTLADLGLAKLSKAEAARFPQLRKEGMILLQEAHDRVQQYSSTPWYIGIEKEFVR